MEEILASIRRIISEDDDTARKPEPALELTQPVAAEPPKAEPAPQDDDLMVFEEEPAPPPPAPTRPEPVFEPPVAAAKPPAPVAEAAGADSLVSELAVSAAAGAFTRLAGSLRIAESPGQTLEGLVREMLRPMMKDWLDQNLPAIVEAKVEAEMERIARMVR